MTIAPDQFIDGVKRASTMRRAQLVDGEPLDFSGIADLDATKTAAESALTHLEEESSRRRAKLHDAKSDAQRVAARRNLNFCIFELNKLRDELGALNRLLHDTVFDLWAEVFPDEPSYDEWWSSWRDLTDADELGLIRFKEQSPAADLRSRLWEEISEFGEDWWDDATHALAGDVAITMWQALVPEQMAELLEALRHADHLTATSLVDRVTAADLARGYDVYNRLSVIRKGDGNLALMIKRRRSPGFISSLQRQVDFTVRRIRRTPPRGARRACAQRRRRGIAKSSSGSDPGGCDGEGGPGSAFLLAAFAAFFVLVVFGHACGARAEGGEVVVAYNPTGVKTSLEPRRPAAPERDCIFMSSAEDAHMAIHDARSGIVGAKIAIERLETGRERDPEATLLQVQREWGASATIEETIERERANMVRAEAELGEAERFPQEYEEVLCDVIGVDNPHNAAYEKAARKFREVYGSMHPVHTKWVIARSAVEAEHDFGDETVFKRRSGWGEDGVWRTGDDVYETIVIDPHAPELQAPVVERTAAHSPGELFRAILSSLRKAAVIARYHEVRDNSGGCAFRCQWQHWTKIVVSTLAQTTGVNYRTLVDDTEGLPDAGTIKKWEAEINVLDSEDQAKLRLWESVYSRYAEDEEWATHLEHDAERQRVWAAHKRSRVEAELGRLIFTHPGVNRLKRPAPGVMPRAPRICNTRRRRVSTTRRVQRGGDSGDDPPGDSSEPALGRHARGLDV